jgi:CBS domain containing-hemolysin-like protein
MYFAVSNARKKTLKEMADSGNHRAARALEVSDSASSLLTTQQYMTILLTSISTAVLSARITPELGNQLVKLGVSTTWADPLAFVILLPPFALLVLLVGYQLPSAMISGRAEGFALTATPTIRTVIRIVGPSLKVSQVVGHRMGILLGGKGIVSPVTEEEIMTLVDAGSEEGTIENEEKQLIYSVFKFGETVVREVMVPRIDIIGIEANTKLEDALDIIIQAGHSRIPVFSESIDSVLGFLYAKDLLVLWRNQKLDVKLESVLREPYFVPETMKAQDLLENFQSRETHIAIVNDEYGGTAGLVTIEDLVEELVGEIRDEYDFLEEEPYEVISETEYICSAGIDLDDLNDLLELSLPTDENDTLGGFIFSELGKVPEVGDKVTASGAEFEVLTLKGRHRLHKVRVVKLARDGNGNGAPVSVSEATISK